MRDRGAEDMRLHCRLQLYRQARRRTTWAARLRGCDRSQGIQDRRLQFENETSVSVASWYQDNRHTFQGPEERDSKPTSPGRREG